MRIVSEIIRQRSAAFSQTYATTVGQSVFDDENEKLQRKYDGNANVMDASVIIYHIMAYLTNCSSVFFVSMENER